MAYLIPTSSRYVDTGVRIYVRHPSLLSIIYELLLPDKRKKVLLKCCVVLPYSVRVCYGQILLRTLHAVYNDEISATMLTQPPT